MFDKPGDCVSRKNFEVQEVLESGDAIALEIRETIGGHIFTSDLEVLILAQEGSNFYNNQIVKAPRVNVQDKLETISINHINMEIQK